MINTYVKIFKGDYEDCVGRVVSVQDDLLTVFIYHVSNKVYKSNLPLNNADVKVGDCWCLGVCQTPL